MADAFLDQAIAASFAAKHPARAGCVDVVETRLIKTFGYNEVSATGVLNYVASIFASGDAKD